MDLIEEMLHEIGVITTTCEETQIDIENDENDSPSILSLKSDSSSQSSAAIPEFESESKLESNSDFPSSPPSSMNNSRKRPAPSPQTPQPSLTSKRHRSDSLLDPGEMEFISISPDKRTPVKADVEAILRSITRRSPRDHSKPPIPLSAQAEALKKKARRAMLTPSRPPFHVSPVRPHNETGLYTPQCHNHETHEKQRRRHSDGASLTNRKLKLADLPCKNTNSLPTPTISTIVVTPPASPALIREKNNNTSPSQQVTAPNTPASGSLSFTGRPRRSAATRSHKVLF